MEASEQEYEQCARAVRGLQWLAEPFCLSCLPVCLFPLCQTHEAACVCRAPGHDCRAGLARATLCRRVLLCGCWMRTLQCGSGPKDQRCSMRCSLHVSSHCFMARTQHAVQHAELQRAGLPGSAACPVFFAARMQHAAPRMYVKRVFKVALNTRGKGTCRPVCVPRLGHPQAGPVACRERGSGCVQSGAPMWCRRYTTAGLRPWTHAPMM